MRTIATVLCAAALISGGKGTVEAAKAPTVAAGPQFHCRRFEQAGDAGHHDTKLRSDLRHRRQAAAGRCGLARRRERGHSARRIRQSRDDAGTSGRHAGVGRLARQLTEKSMVALKAAQSRNVDQVLEAGHDVCQVCEDCHKVYLPQPK
jgi:hypothetical protein